MTDALRDVPALLPCPCCGGVAEPYHRDYGGGRSNMDWVCCIEDDCGLQTGAHETKSLAAAAWNRRAASETKGGGDADRHNA